MDKLTCKTCLVFFWFLSFMILFGCETKLREYWYKDSFDQSFTVVDRGALPELRAFVIADDVLESYIKSDPSEDTANLARAVNDRISNIRAGIDAIEDIETLSATAKTPEAVTRILIPDVISVDFSEAIDFRNFNGRLYGEDATTVMCDIVLGRDKLNDEVEETKIFLNDFPYLERPNTK